MKNTINNIVSVVLAGIICFSCFFYTYADREFPGKERQITVTSEYNDNVTIAQLADQYRSNEEKGIDFSPIAKRMNLKFEGKIKVDQIVVAEDGQLVASTNDAYWDYGKVPALFYFNNSGESAYAGCAKIAIYFTSANPKILAVGETINFKADFSSMDGHTITLTNGVLE